PFSIYPALGAFMSARNFQTTTGIQRFLDQDALGTNRIEPDGFYYDAAVRMIEREREKGPMFLFVYLAANHYPWNHRWRPELAPDWKAPGNAPDVDEYLRRQSMSFSAYAELLDRLRRQFPGEPFLLVRYGDHQPDFASVMLEPALDEPGVNQRLMTYDPRYYTTYYAIDVINFKPASLASALDTIEGPYLPLVLQEAACNNTKERRAMTKHRTGTREEWLAARLELLEAEKELTRRSDELARRRQELPWVRIDKEYRFETDEGKASLADLFKGRSQLLVYHFMFGPDYSSG